jgi:hypothetical protein
MTTKIPTIEKILGEALELHEKGVSLHSIVRTYPEHKVEIEELFGSMATISLEKEKIRVPEGGLEAILRSLPDTEPARQKVAIKSPFTILISSLSSLRFVLPIAALALLTGGIFIHKGTAPSAMMPTPTMEPSVITPNNSIAQNKTNSTTKQTTPSMTGPMRMAALAPNASQTDRMVASFSNEAANESTIAKSNDAMSQQAISTDKQLTTDPTQTYAN